MTLLLAGATRPMAFVAADTRLNMRFKTGDAGFHDEGELTVSLNGGEIYTGPTHRKIQDLRLGWIGGAGHHLFNRVTLGSLSGADARDLTSLRVTSRENCCMSRSTPGSSATPATLEEMVPTNGSGDQGPAEGCWVGSPRG